MAHCCQNVRGNKTKQKTKMTAKNKQNKTKTTTKRAEGAGVEKQITKRMVK